MRIRIPIARPDIGARERREVAAALREGGISGKARHVTDFEAALAGALAPAPAAGRPARAGAGGRPVHAVAVSSGTAALHLALASLDLGPGDEVILPDLTYVATANAVRYTGATPRLVDVDPHGWALDPEAVAERLGPRTRAIVAVHLYGSPAPLGALRRLARSCGAALVEDAAQALGARLAGTPVGGIGDVGCFSFFANKVVTTGEGGMVVTRSARRARRLRGLRDHAAVAGSRYRHDELGYNYRMPALSAAVGVAQMQRLDAFCQRRRRVARWYAEALAEAPLPLEAPRPPADAEPVPWLCTYRIRGAGRRRRDRVLESLHRAGIDARPVFEPMSSLPMYRTAGRPGRNAAAIAGEALSLPTYPSLRRSEVHEIAERLVRALHAARGR